MVCNKKEIENKIEQYLKSNGSMFPSELAEKVGCGYFEVLDVLKGLQRRGLVGTD